MASGAVVVLAALGRWRAQGQTQESAPDMVRGVRVARYVLVVE
jgi:hypothetical protein